MTRALYGWTYYPHPGRSIPCVYNDDFIGQEFLEHRMKAVYMRNPISESNKSRSMKHVGFYCSRCDKIWTLKEVDAIMEQRNKEKRQRAKMEKEKNKK